MIEPVVIALSAGSLVAWLYLTFFHGGFWRADQLLDGDARPPSDWPPVVAVVPARDEADVIQRSIGSLLDQDYPGPFAVLLVDDHSDDCTGERAERLAAEHPRGSRLTVVEAAELPVGWTGKTWAVATGVEAAPVSEYLLLTDADVAHSPRNLRRLVAKAEAEAQDLVSLMVRLHCRRGWERVLIPAFVYFFQQLYPFPRVNEPAARAAAAAGGCMLVRRSALERAGGIEAICGELIDDCALAHRLKRHGPIWLGLTKSEKSLRPYCGPSDVWNMVARTAYTQLRHSTLLLAGTVAGLALVYLVPPLLALGWPLHRSAAAGLLGLVAWLLMAITFVPTLRLYRRSLAMAPGLPLAGLLYLGMTVDSARRHWLGKGASWKGRTVRESVRRSASPIASAAPPSEGHGANSAQRSPRGTGRHLPPLG